MTTKQSLLNKSNGEKSKKGHFINNIDHTPVTELNLLLDNSQNCTLDIKQINTFASKMQIFFNKVQNNLLEHTQLSQRKLKI